MLSDGFPAVAAPDARVLILGSLPGPLSLARQQYYAKPQNAFWRIMGHLVGASPDLPYANRLERLTASRIAMWDVCRSAFRQGALDTAIQPASVVVNDVAAFLDDHADIVLIGFNGAKAAAIYLAKILPLLSPAQQSIDRVVLPSTSPALAAMSVETKRLRWSEALRRANII